MRCSVFVLLVGVLVPALHHGGGVVAGSMPAFSPLVFTAPSGALSDKLPSLGVTTTAGEHVNVYYSSNGFSLVNGTGMWSLPTPSSCQNGDPCQLIALQQSQPGIACWVLDNWYGCLNASSKEFLWTVEVNTNDYPNPISSGTIINGTAMMFQRIPAQVAEPSTELQWIDLYSGLNLLTLTVRSAGSVLVDCDGPSGMCVLFNGSSVCAFSWGELNTTCAWQKHHTVSQASDISAITIVAPVFGGRTFLTLLSSSFAIQAFNLTTGALVYQVTADGEPYNHSVVEFDSFSGPFVCRNYIVTMATRAVVSVWRADDPAGTRVSTSARAASANPLQHVGVECNGTHIVATATDVVHAFRTSPTDRVRLVGSFQPSEFESATFCAVSGLISLLCLVPRSVLSVDLLGPELHPFAASAIKALSSMPTGVGSVVLAEGSSLLTFITAEWNFQGADISIRPRAFGRNETLAATTYLPVAAKLLVTTRSNDGLSVVSAQDMQLLFDTAVVAADTSANNGSHSGARPTPSSPTFFGQASINPFIVAGPNGSTLAVAAGVYGGDTNVENTGVTCLNAFSMETGVKAWQACAQTQVGALVHTKTRIFAAAFYPDESFTNAVVYGFNAADGSMVFPNVTVESEPVGFIADENGSTVFVATFAFNTPKVTALSGETGSVLWTSLVYDGQYATRLFPPKLENGLLYACVTLSQFNHLLGHSVICTQLAVETGEVTETIHVHAGVQDLFFSGGRCFTLTQGLVGWAVVELFWGTGNTPQPETVVTLPAPNCFRGNSRQVTVLGTSGPLLALLVTDQCLLATTFTIFVYNLVGGPFQQGGSLVWSASNVVLVRGGWQTTLAVEDAEVDPDAGLLYVTTATFAEGLLQVSGTAFCVLSFYTGEVIACYPAKSYVPVAAAGGVVNGTALVGVTGGNSITRLAGLGHPTAPPYLTTISPKPPPTITPFPTPAPTTTTTTPAPTTTTTTTTPPSTTPFPPPPTTTRPPYPTATTTTPAPPPSSSAAPSSAAGDGPSRTVLGAGIGGGVLLVAAGVLGCYFVCVRRRAAQEESAGGGETVAPLNDHADDSLITIDFEGRDGHRREAASTGFVDTQSKK